LRCIRCTRCTSNTKQELPPPVRYVHRYGTVRTDEAVDVQLEALLRQDQRLAFEVYSRADEEQLLHRNVERFRGWLVFKARRLLYHSTLGLRVIKKKKYR